ncbi:hypothetical protein BDD16_000379 [Sphaerotilus montanus]|uniref:Uncharacterized protein n=1 Tax=Sphaerotilus montanus TaxID=522889 RepID=A0A7Y9U3Z2_9BURK|nr:hypothetical protein [Sphaerotilus montanus]
MAPAGAAGRAHGPRRVIVRPRPHWVHLLFVRRGSMVRQILAQQLFTVGFALLVALAHGCFFQWKVTLTRKREKPRPSGRGGRAQARAASRWLGG